MLHKLILSCCVIVAMLLQPMQGSAASAKPGHRACRSHHYYHRSYHNDPFKGFFKERDKNVTDWGAYLDYLCIGPAGAVCGLAGVIKRQEGAAIVMTIGVIETAVEAACLSHYGSQ